MLGVQAIVGHTAVPYLEDDRLQVSAENAPDEICACIAHNTEVQNLECILINDVFFARGGGITDAVQSQLSAFHIGDERFKKAVVVPRRMLLCTAMPRNPSRC